MSENTPRPPVRVTTARENPDRLAQLEAFVAQFAARTQHAADDLDARVSRLEGTSATMTEGAESSEVEGNEA